MGDSHQRTFIYHIDGDDNISYINPEWLKFARENYAGNLDDHSLIGTSLWRHIVDTPTVHIYQTLVQKVRSGQPFIKIPYRCDSPDKRRFMEMKIVSSDQRTIAFENIILREESRPAINLLSMDLPRNGRLVLMCGWCKKIKTRGGWLETEDAVIELKIFNKELLPGITHGICNGCKMTMMKKYLY